MASVVYFIRPVGQLGPIKIGYSDYPEARLLSLTTWSPVDLEIAATVPGDRDLEYRIQCVFADLHWRREWFRPDARLIAAVEKLRAAVPVEQAIDFTDIRGDLRVEHYLNRSRAIAARRPGYKGRLAKQGASS
jgi:hypothetical protein